MKILDKTIKALNTSLNYRNLRQQVISSNIANAQTPGYKAKRVDFENALANALDVDENLTMKSDDSGHFKAGYGGLKHLRPSIYQDPNGVISEDGNSVNREEEMSLMAENKILYDASVQLLNRKLGQLKYVLNSER